MSSTPAFADHADAARPRHDDTHDEAQRDADTAYYRQMLHELAEMAMDLARAVHRQATQPSTDPAPEPGAAPAPASNFTAAAVALDRLARTVRRTVALARTLADPAPPHPATQAASRRLAARKQLIRAVEDRIQRRTEGATDAVVLRAELHERLDTPDLDDDLAHLPVAELVKAICRDLGLENDIPGLRPWPRRTPAELRALCLRAAQPAPKVGPWPAAQPTTPRPARELRGPGPLHAARPTPHPPPRPGTGPPAA